ncbi:MAG: PAAR domain-containing protein [Acidimicrobiales bacterium]
MGQPAARMTDSVVGVDVHIVMIPSPGGPVPTPLPHPFNGKIMSGCSTDVMIANQPAAVVGATANCIPPHIPQGGPFQIPPTNQGTIQMGSTTVLINNKPAARVGDTVMTCADPAPTPNSKIAGPGAPTVLIA